MQGRGVCSVPASQGCMFGAPAAVARSQLPPALAQPTLLPAVPAACRACCLSDAPCCLPELRLLLHRLPYSAHRCLPCLYCPACTALQVEKKLLKAGVVIAPPPPKYDSDDEGAQRRARTMRSGLAQQRRQRTQSDEDSDFD